MDRLNAEKRVGEQWQAPIEPGSIYNAPLQGKIMHNSQDYRLKAPGFDGLRILYG